MVSAENAWSADRREDDLKLQPVERSVIVSVINVSKWFEQPSGRSGTPKHESRAFLALRTVTCDIHAGEFVSFLGASGCGKTTLLKIIAGLVTPDDGVVSVNGASVTAPRRDLCMVFQNFGLLPWRTAQANIEFPLELDGVPAPERKMRAQKLIETVGLKGFEQHFPHEMSGGMQQRVGIARALIRKPLVLLMDEPFAALDAMTRETLQEDFLRICREVKTTVVLVTHSIEEALLLSDRIVVFTPRPGTIRDILDDPLGELRTQRGVRGTVEFAHWGERIRDLLRGEA